MIEKRSSAAAERVFTVGVYAKDDALGPELALEELASLVEAAGGTVVGNAYQNRSTTGRDGSRAISAATYIGSGKAKEVASLAEAHEAQLVVFDCELTPAQIRELEKVLGCKVIDRSELILDIFASRARTREAKRQVELAQLEYTAPRLRGMWTHLERQAGKGATGGLGTRGPGEKQIEVDRRIVSKRISRLKAELQAMHERKEREVRDRTMAGYCVGLVGYTNAGKSTLMNRLCGSDTYVADQLFATLDTKTRRWQLEAGAPVLLSDTVGFVRNLPHHLVASFRTTLEEALSASLLLHVVDASHPQATEQIAAVEQVLTDLGCELSRVVPVLNKMDAVHDADTLAILESRWPDAISVSALEGAGIEALRAAVVERRHADWVRVSVRASAGNGKLQAFARAEGTVAQERYDEALWVAELDVPRSRLDALRALVGEDGMVFRS